MAIELIATAESVSQAQCLLTAGVDILQIGNDEFGLRLPHSFDRYEQREIIALAHQAGKKVDVAVNAIFHNDRIDLIAEYLQFLKEVGADTITLGDPGVIEIMRKTKQWIPFRYDAGVMVTSARQLNFWAKRGAVAGVMAREVPKDELAEIMKQVLIPVEVLVYGPTCIHQSKRPLLENYFHFIGKEDSVDRGKDLFISEPMKPQTHYSIYQDRNGTHIFSSNDVSLAQELPMLSDLNVGQWKCDGLYTEEDDFVAVVEALVAAKNKVEKQAFTKDDASELVQLIKKHHPKNRELDTGFFYKNPQEVR